jgi:hypothetical protein
MSRFSTEFLTFLKIKIIDFSLGLLFIQEYSKKRKDTQAPLNVLSIPAL